MNTVKSTPVATACRSDASYCKGAMTFMRSRLLTVPIALLLLLSPVLNAAEQAPRPARWAQSVPAKHLKNFYKLDDKVYRSAQPDEKGFQEMEAMGVRTVLSFRNYHSDNEEAEGRGIKLLQIKMEAGEIETSQVIDALRIIKDSDGPIVIHCWHGSDRTGLISAMYRIVFQGWSKDDAIDELMHGGYGYHSLYKNIPEYIRNVDIEEVKKGVNAL